MSTSAGGGGGALETATSAVGGATRTSQPATQSPVATAKTIEFNNLMFIINSFPLDPWLPALPSPHKAGRTSGFCQNA
jgi:hypothetical protein